jgi:dipeptidase D
MNMDKISRLEPTLLWHYFNEITQIPHPSKKEEKIVAYIVDFAQRHGLSLKRDRANNLLVTKPATPGFEHLPTVVLQSHLDMVCEKNNDVQFDFNTDAIQTEINGDWLSAKGTTLGADNGVGVATELALLASDTVEHGKLECLFTVDEETGLTGAKALEPGFFTGKILINLDSEEEGYLYVGCAGGMDTIIRFKYESQPTPEKLFFFRLDVKGLTGGHSGGDIHKGLANANKLLVHFLQTISAESPLYISEIGGGNLRNAIAREAFVIAGVPFPFKERVRVLLSFFAADMEEQYGAIDPHIRFDLESIEAPTDIIDPEVAKRLLEALVACPHGVIAMSQDIEGLVETSANMASVKQNKEQGIMEVVTSQRSAIEHEKKAITEKIESIFTQGGAVVTHGEGYPGWKPNLQSPILQIVRDSYQRLFDKQPHVLAIHAGLECGLFLEKYPDLDMVSFGPTMEGVHSPQERLFIPSVPLFWNHLLDVLKNVH